MVALLLRLLPTAEIYVVRVAREAHGLSATKENIAVAIRIQQEWHIDIISISHGFSDEVPKIREAIVDAEKAKQRKILFFAAANNIGLNLPEMFPAFLESIIAVRSTRYDEVFRQYDPAPWSHKEGMNYRKLGKDVVCGWTPCCLVKSSCSVATPTMVAIAATIIWFVACQENRLREGARDVIQTRRGILSVFGAVTEPDGVQAILGALAVVRATLSKP